MAGVRPASSSGAGSVQRTASGSVSGPGPTHTGRLAPGSHRLDADLGTQAMFQKRGGADPIRGAVTGGFRIICVILKQVGTFTERQSIRKHFAHKNPAVSLAVYVSCYCKPW